MKYFLHYKLKAFYPLGSVTFRRIRFRFMHRIRKQILEAKNRGKFTSKGLEMAEKGRKQQESPGRIKESNRKTGRNSRSRMFFL